MAKDKTKNKNSLKIRIIIAVVFVALLASTYFVRFQIENFLNSLFYPEVSEDLSNSKLLVHFINVGNADAIAVELPNGEHLLIDSGNDNNTSRTKLIEYLNNNFFDANEDKVFDYFILTHSHADHVGGGVQVFENFVVEKCFRPNQFTEEEALDRNITEDNNIVKSSQVFEDYVDAMNLEGCDVEFVTPNSDIITSSFTLDFLSPNTASYSNKNNYSPIMILTYANKKIMFTGDAEKLVENEVLDLYDQSSGPYSRSELDIDILKVGHHGSKTSSSKNFLTATSPDYAVICTDGKEYGHPNQETLDNLKTAGVNNVYRTDLNGDIVMGVSADGEIAAVLGAYTKGFKVEWYQLVIVICGIGLTIIFVIGTKKQNKVLKQLNKRK